jgi:methyltransferase (TIGR00027 family)
MRDQKASRTAFGVAMRRAAHQALDKPLVFDDPLAIPIIGEAGAARMLERESLPNLRAFIAVRSRYSEDQLAKAVARGVRQYVVLGAGFDTFAYRNPYIKLGLRVFEVDHPATQEWKRHQLKLAGIAVPDQMRFVPVDFEQQSLEEELDGGGFHAGESSFFSWLGVVPYLTESAFDSTISYIARIAPGSAIVFDYGVPIAMLSPSDQLRFEELAARVASAGEPLTLFFEPEQLASRLRQMGFRHFDDLDGAALNARYFTNRSDGLETGRLGRLMCAGR